MNGQQDNPEDDYSRGFFARLFSSILRDLIVIAIVFVAATGISAGVCLYYGVPLIFALVGGFISLGVVLVLNSGSIFD